MLLLFTSLAFATFEPTPTSSDSPKAEQGTTVQEEEVSQEETKEVLATSQSYFGRCDVLNWQ